MQTLPLMSHGSCNFKSRMKPGACGHRKDLHACDDAYCVQLQHLLLMICLLRAADVPVACC
jgi:hypothetical protein